MSCVVLSIEPMLLGRQLEAAAAIPARIWGKSVSTPGRSNVWLECRASSNGMV
jgi:hypothetical protein